MKTLITIALLLSACTKVATAQITPTKDWIMPDSIKSSTFKPKFKYEVPKNSMITVGTSSNLSGVAQSYIHEGKIAFTIVGVRNGKKVRDTLIRDPQLVVRMLINQTDKAIKKQELYFKMEQLVKAWEFKTAADKAKFNKLRKQYHEIQ